MTKFIYTSAYISATILCWCGVGVLSEDPSLAKLFSESECKDQSYCTIMPENYNQNEMDNYVNDMNSKGLLTENFSSGYRVPYVEGNEENCETRVRFVKPYVVKTNSSTIKLVVQTKLFDQTIETRECINEDRSCLKDVMQVDRRGSETICKTQKSEIKLYIRDEGEFRAVPVPVSVGCSCMIKMSPEDMYK